MTDSIFGDDFDAEDEGELDHDPVLGQRVVGEGIALVDPFTAQSAPVPVIGGTVFLVGATGGAGVSTLARLANEVAGTTHVGEGFDPERFTGLADFRASGFYGAVPYGAPVWIVASMSHRSLDAATSLLSRHSRGEIPWSLEGLIGVHGPGKAGDELEAKAKGIRPAMPKTMWIPWLGENPQSTSLPRRAKDVLRYLTTQAAAKAATDSSKENS